LSQCTRSGDGQTDRQTDGHLSHRYTALASYAALKKIIRVNDTRTWHLEKEEEVVEEEENANLI